MIDTKLFDELRSAARGSTHIRTLLDVIYSTVFTHLGEVCVVDGISHGTEQFAELETVLLVAQFAHSDRDAS